MLPPTNSCRIMSKGSRLSDEMQRKDIGFGVVKRLLSRGDGTTPRLQPSTPCAALCPMPPQAPNGA